MVAHNFTDVADEQNSHHTLLSLYTDYYEQNLEQNIYQRHHQYNFYTENELWCYLYQMLHVATVMQQHEMWVGDIRPHTIFLTKDQNCKLWPSNVFPGEETDYQKIMNKEQRILLPPEILKLYSQGIFNSMENLSKQDTFQIGMTMLELATLTSASLCYDYKDFTFQQQFLDDLLNKLANQEYSALLQAFIKWLLFENPEIRPAPDEAIRALEPYEELIINKESFIMDQQNLSQIMLMYNYQPIYNQRLVNIVGNQQVSVV